MSAARTADRPTVLGALRSPRILSREVLAGLVAGVAQPVLDSAQQPAQLVDLLGVQQHRSGLGRSGIGTGHRCAPAGAAAVLVTGEVSPAAAS